MRRPGIAAREKGEKTLCANIHPQGVPVPIQDEYRVRLKLRDEKLHGVVHRLCFGCVEIRCVEIGVTIKRSIARREQQRIALTQGNLQCLSKTHNHLPARLCAAGFDAAQMTG